MKRFVSLIVSIAIAGCISIAAPRVALGQETLVKLVPEDAVFFKSGAEFEKTWASITGSNFWKRLMALKVWDDTGARAGLRDFAQEFSGHVGVELSAKNIMSLVGKEMAIAAFVQPGESPKIEGFLLCRGNPKSVLEDVVKKLFDAIKAQIEGQEGAAITTTAYKGTSITSIKSTDPSGPPIEVQFGFIDDVFVFGIGNTEPRLKAIVDLAGGTGNSLANNSRFKKISDATRMSTGRYGGSFYVDFQKVGQVFAAMDPSQFPMPMQAAINGLKQSFSMPIILGGNYYYDRGCVAKIVSMPTGGAQNELMELSLSTPPATGTNINYVPDNAIVYVGANNIPDWQKMWPLLLKQWEQQGAMMPINTVLSQIEAAIGIKIAEDVIPWIGNEFAVVFSDIDTKAGFPYPKFALMLKIKDKQKANAFVQKIESILKEVPAETGVKFDRTLYENCNLDSVTITLPIPLPLTVNPSFGIVDDFLIVSSSIDLLKQMIDISKGRGKDLASNAAFKALNVPAKTNSVAFLNWVRFMDAVKATAAWVVQFAQSQPEMAETVKPIVDNYVVPIANCLSALESVCGYQINAANITTTTYIIRVKDLPPM